MEQLLERIAKAPLGSKLGVVGLVLILVTVVNYFVMGVNLGASISEIEGPRFTPMTM